MSILGKLVDLVVGSGGHRQTYPSPVIAPVGYDPTQDPDGSEYARLVGQQVPGGGGGILRTLWENVVRSLWWVWAAVAVMSVWGWWWWVARPAKAEARALATATAIAASWTATPMPTNTAATPTSIPPTSTSTPKAALTPTGSRPINTPTATTTPTWTPPPTWTPVPTGTPTPTETPTATNTPVSVQKSPIPAPESFLENVSAKLAANKGFPGDSMVVTGCIDNGSVVRILWEDGTELAKATPGGNGNFAAAFVIPAANKGYHVVRVVWSGGVTDNEIDLVLAMGVSTPTPVPTWTPTPVPTWTPIPTWSPTPTPTRPTPTPFPTPIGGWTCTIFLPLVK